ncbi:hypothetical protein ES319_A06G071600v1 [Gossypium barbadense]|uniref:Uncharacterized protein n=2 Tax=Gossypium TaxID=3633 RepID=A0A5J5VAW9_GOSBA|nr:hypothetical protein ES319_A06G071600v1 [Gossypium barbadense]TYH12609.1 hypothetical protein ES288_A06G081100v1 [Gossypium darwinii]KAB2076928.1 hypothetical protein ES319_A06G071600v1 [Gossypium barbadense]KAB2076929.1 hypothetical protein ES319_A06G071600v1 [Gossypium barbadense]TYH12610.1 hypothetical protein ES288_A06G081100v1 [Gossypium darwinii]
MEDENGLELSLGLSYSALSAQSKGKISSSSDTRTEEGDKGIKIVDDFKNFLQTGTQKQDLRVSSQRSDPVKPLENFFNDLSKAAGDAEASVNLNGKRKILFDEINNPKKLEREAHHVDLSEKAKTSHISMATEDGSTAENEDVAESEVEGSPLRLVSRHDDGSKRFIGVSGSSEVPKEVKLGNLNYGNPYPVQSVNVLNVPFSLTMNDSNSPGTPSSSGRTLPGMIHSRPSGNGERSVNPGNLPVMFGYSPVQLPLLDKDNPWGTVSHSPQFHPLSVGKGPPNPDKHSDGLKISQASVHTIVRNSSEAAQSKGGTFEQVKGEGKQHATEESSCTPVDEDVEGSSSKSLRANAPLDQPTAEGVVTLDFSTIKPGIAADLKFGGSGSLPNLHGFQPQVLAHTVEQFLVSLTGSAQTR